MSDSEPQVPPVTTSEILPPKQPEISSSSEQSSSSKSIMILVPENDLHYIKQLQEVDVIPKTDLSAIQNLLEADLEKKPENILTLPRDSHKNIRKYYDSEFIFLKSGQNLPKTIVIHIPDKHSLDFSYANICKKIWVDHQNLKPEERPSVILHTDNFEIPLQYRHIYEGFLYASSHDDLKKTVERVQKEDSYKDSKIFDPQELAPAQKESYDASIDLREWEHVTADTYQTLKNILARIKLRQEILYERYTKLFHTSETGEISWNTPQPRLSIPINTILDIGTGEGRIAQMLARIPELNVVGVDVSPEMLKRAKERIKQEGEGLRGEKLRPGLSYEAMNRLVEEDKQMVTQGEVLQEEGRYLQSTGQIEEGKRKEKEGIELAKGILPRNSQGKPIPILDDEEVSRHYLFAEGNFFTLFEDMNKFMVEWADGKKYSDIDQKAFFPNHNYGYAFTNRNNMFLDAGFDMATITWNTICEIGDPKNQQKFIHNVLRLLTPGGELYIEISNRDLEPHKSSIQSHHESHPDEPIGTVQDKKTDGSGHYPRRYFANIKELAEWCKMNGCDVDFERDITTFKAGSDNDPDNVYALTVRKVRW